MKNKKIWLALGILALAFSIISIIITQAIGACECGIETAAGSEVPMKCFWTEKAVMLVSVIPAFLAVCQLFVKEKGAAMISAAGILVCAVIIILLTTGAGIGVCAAEGMACGKMALFVRIDMIALIIVSIIQMAAANKKEGPKRGF